jgi:hypothetical protein
VNKSSWIQLQKVFGAAVKDKADRSTKELSASTHSSRRITTYLAPKIRAYANLLHLKGSTRRIESL